MIDVVTAARPAPIRRTLRRTASVTARRVGAATSADEIAWAFRKLLEQEAREQPLVCVFDDVHWGEEKFLDLVEHVADFVRDAPILLLCLARPELLERRAGWGGGKWNATTVLLEPLDARETEQLLDALGSAEGELRQRIVHAAEGNPLFLEEMVAFVRESGDGEVAVPPTIQALLAARLDQLDPGERSVLERGAVEGRVFHRSAVQALDGDEPQLQTRLVSLVRKELVRPEPTQLSGRRGLSLPASPDQGRRLRSAPESRPRGAARAVRSLVRGAPRRISASSTRSSATISSRQRATRRSSGDRTPSSPGGQENGWPSPAAEHIWRGDHLAAASLLKRAVELLRRTRLDVSLELDLASAQPTPQRAAAIAEAAAERALAAGDRARRGCRARGSRISRVARG